MKERLHDWILIIELFEAFSDQKLVDHRVENDMPHAIALEPTKHVFK